MQDINGPGSLHLILPVTSKDIMLPSNPAVKVDWGSAILAITNFFELGKTRPPPFYTHEKGYKVRLELYPKGQCDGAGTHISCYMCLMKGDYDEELVWPFVTKYKLDMLDLTGDGQHETTVVDPRQLEQHTYIWCKPVNDMNFNGYGTHTLISHAKLQEQSSRFIRGGTLYIRFTQVQK